MNPKISQDPTPRAQKGSENERLLCRRQPPDQDVSHQLPLDEGLLIQLAGLVNGGLGFAKGLRVLLFLLPFPLLQVTHSRRIRIAD